MTIKACWNPRIECMDHNDLRKLQLERLQETIERVYFNVPCYRQKMQEAGLGPESLQHLEDLGKFPFATKEHLNRLHNP